MRNPRRAEGRIRTDTRKGNTMADLIAIGYPDLTTADAAADEARRLAAAIRK